MSQAFNRDETAWVKVAEWKLKCEAIEKREAERREADAKKHKEEVAFLENHGKLSIAASELDCVDLHDHCKT